MSCVGTCILWKKSFAESWIFLSATCCFFSSCKSAYLRARHNPAYKHSWEMNACAGSVEWWHTTKGSCYRTHFVGHTFLWTKLQPVFTPCQRAYLWCRPNMSTHFVLCSRLQYLCTTWALSPYQYSAFCVWQTKIKHLKEWKQNKIFKGRRRNILSFLYLLVDHHLMKLYCCFLVIHGTQKLKLLKVKRLSSLWNL